MTSLRKLCGLVLPFLLLLLADAGIAAGRELVPSGMQLANNAVLAMY